MSYSPDDRIEFYKHEAQVKHKEAIEAWLRANPSVGVLNKACGGQKYYTYDDAVFVEVKEFTVISH